MSCQRRHDSKPDTSLKPGPSCQSLRLSGEFKSGVQTCSGFRCSQWSGTHTFHWNHLLGSSACEQNGRSHLERLFFLLQRSTALDCYITLVTRRINLFTPRRTLNKCHQPGGIARANLMPCKIQDEHGQHFYQAQKSPFQGPSQCCYQIKART